MVRGASKRFKCAIYFILQDLMPPPSMAQGTAFVTMARNTLSVYDVSCANIASMDPLRMRHNRSTPHRTSLSLKQCRLPSKY